MSERDGPSGLPATMPMDDLELVSRYLNQQLDAERAEQVRVRLESDPDFYNLAEPLLFAWSVPRHVERHPRPSGELEEMWDRFTKRAGFVHQRRRAHRRRLWLLAIVAFAIGIPAFVMRGQLAKAYRDFRDFETVRPDTGWITLRDSNQVRLAPGARLRSSSRTENGVHRVRLEGSARFRVFSPDTLGPVPMLQPLLVETRGGVAFTGMGEFTVSARGDTTDVEVHRPSKRRFIGFMTLPTTVLVETDVQGTPMSLGETQTARLIRGSRAIRIER